jgi:hypothetical protein
MLGICNKEPRTHHRRRRPLLVSEEAGAGEPRSAWRFALARTHPRTR